MQQAILDKKDQTQHKGQSKSRVSQDAKGNVKGEYRTVCARGGQPRRGDQMGSQEKYKNERQDKRANRALPIIHFQTEVGERQQPAEQRHRPVEVVIRDSVKTFRSQEKRKIMDDQAEDKQNRAQASSQGFARVQKP